MKIPETLSTKSVVIGFLLFILLIGGSIGAFLLDEHENGGGREGYSSRRKMKDEEDTQSDSRYQSEKQDSDIGDSQRDNNNTPEQKPEPQDRGSTIPVNISTTSLPVSSLTGVTGSGINPTPNR